MMTPTTTHRQRFQTVCTTLILIASVSMACSRSTPTEPMSGPGPIGPIGPQGTGIEGSGVYVEQDRAVSGFNGVRLLSVASVLVEQGGNERLMVKAEDNVISHILTEVVGGVLEISTEAGISFDDIGPIQVFVTARDLSSLELDGVGDMQLMGLSFSNLHVELNGTGDLDLSNLDGERLEVFMDGVGHIKMAGQATEQIVDVTGIGDYKAKRLRSTRADVTTRNLGNATVRVSQHLTATIRGIGSIYYYGDPTVESTVTGSGQVVQQEG